MKYPFAPHTIECHTRRRVWSIIRRLVARLWRL